MPKLTLTSAQLRLIYDLLQDHMCDGSYWGKKRDHEKLVLWTISLVKNALKGTK